MNKFLLIVSLFLPWVSVAQDLPGADTSCVQRDLADVIRSALNKPAKTKESTEGSLLLIPVIGSNPATGFVFGVGGQYAFKMPEATLYSMISGTAQVTTKNQYIFMLKNNIYSKRQRFFYSGDWRFQIFSQPTYGLGTNSPEGGVLDYQYNLGGIETSSDSLTQPMKFNFARLHQSMGFKVREGIYLGFGYQYDGYGKIIDEKLRLTPGDSLITSHYAYNTQYGFDLDSYYSSAINLSLIIDTRDNMINAYKGYFASISWRGASRLTGNRTTDNIFQVEWRSFHGVSKKNPAHLVAFWLMGNFSAEGDFPYMNLPATAYDQRGRSARGYTQGRFRGNNLVYGESEYRFPISKCGGILSGVLFLNATTANNPAQNLSLFESVRPGYGFGLRILIDKKSRTTLAIDIGFSDKTSGFYLAAAETF
ncbi:MAG: hypothetical protein JNM57_07695 [Cyclobacteriaceae bacterium]|nr:hypothetical protein [Cyclobacteriaceae bacterium]